MCLCLWLCLFECEYARCLTLMLIDSLLLLFSFAVMPGPAIYNLHLSTMTVDVGKHVMRICHTDYDQHTANDYCLIVAFWSNGQAQDFFWFQFKSTKRKKNSASMRIRERDRKKAPRSSRQSFMTLFFCSWKKRYQREILTSHCGCLSIETGRTVYQSDHYDCCWSFFALKMIRYARIFRWIFMFEIGNLEWQRVDFGHVCASVS